MPGPVGVVGPEKPVKPIRIFEARHRPETFGCYDVYRCYTDGTEDIDPDGLQVTGRGATRYAESMNRWNQKYGPKDEHQKN